jgi:hypothetical protein
MTSFQGMRNALNNRVAVVIVDNNVAFQGLQHLQFTALRMLERSDLLKVTQQM